MKTKGLQALHGYVLSDTLASASGYGQVPLQFWNRLKHAVSVARLVDEFRTDEAQAKGRESDPGREERVLFERWSTRLFDLPPGHYAGQRLLPWTRGWTDDHIDTYLTRAAP